MCIIEMRVVYGNFAHREFIGRNWLNVNGYFIYTGNMFSVLCSD